MSQPAIQVQSLTACRVAQLVRYAPAFGPAHVGPVAGPMFEEVADLLEAVNAPVVGPPQGVYDMAAPDEPGAVRITVAFPVPPFVTEVAGLEVATLPGIERAATIVFHGAPEGTYHGAPDGIGGAWVTFLDRLDAQGYAMTHHTREIYLSPPGLPEEDWDTLLVAELA